MFDNRFGKIVLIQGPMFAGKTGRLIHYANEAFGRNLNPLFVSHTLNTRDFLSRDKTKTLHPMIKYIKTGSVEDIIKTSKGHKVILIDEAFFFDNIIKVNELANKGVTVILTSLVFSSEMRMFNEIRELYPWVDEFESLLAHCSDCKDKYGAFTVYVGSEYKEEILVGDSCYKTVCRKCLIENYNKEE